MFTLKISPYSPVQLARPRITIHGKGGGVLVEGEGERKGKLCLKCSVEQSNAP